MTHSSDEQVEPAGMILSSDRCLSEIYESLLFVSSYCSTLCILMLFAQPMAVDASFGLKRPRFSKESTTRKPF